MKERKGEEEGLRRKPDKREEMNEEGKDSSCRVPWATIVPTEHGHF